MAQKLPPLLSRDYRMGRFTPETLSPFLIPQNSVKDSLNVNYDEIVGLGKVRAATTPIGDSGPGSDGFMPQGIAEFVPGLGASLGSELVTNGAFTGNADGWTLGDGWAYGTNNVTWTLLGSELITNGSFTGSATGWFLGALWAYSSNNVERLASTSIGSGISQPMVPVVGDTYRCSVTLSGTNGHRLYAGVGFNGAQGLNGATDVGSLGDGTHVFDTLGQSYSPSFQLTTYTVSPSNPSFAGFVDDISVKHVNQGTLSQDIGAQASYTYEVAVTAGGTTGYVTVSLGGASFNIAAGSTVTQQITASAATLAITASTDFDGTVDDVSVKQVLGNYLLVVYNGVEAATLYYWDGTQWNTSMLTDLTNDALNRFTVFGGKAFLTNSEDGMYSSSDADTWSQGAANDCIETTDAKPSLIFRYKQRLLAAGDPTYPDRVFFSSIIDPASTPFITWNTDEATGDWIDVNPDDGGNVTGFSENSTFCLIFKNTGMYRMETVSKTVDPDNIYNVGATSQEAIVLCQGVTYFFSGDGVYRTNGGYPELISRNGVQDVIDALDPSDWQNVRGGTDGFNVYFSLGQVTMHKNQTNERVLNNVVIKFSVRDQSWSVHTYRDYYGMFCQFTDGNGQLMRGASDAGDVQTINLGTLDGGTDGIPFYLETQDQEFGDRSHLKGISDKIAVFADNGQSSSFAARIDGNMEPVTIPMQLNQRVNVGTDINLQGNFFNFIWSGVSTGSPPIFEGYYIEDIQDQGMGSAQGSSQAPAVTTPLA